MKGIIQIYYWRKCNEVFIDDYNSQSHKIFNTTADLSDSPQNIKNILQYFQSGIVNDSATSSLEDAFTTAMFKNEWSEEYMLAYVRDNDIYTEGYDFGRLDILISLVNNKTLSIE